MIHFLNFVTDCKNSTCNETTDYTPSELLLGKELVCLWTNIIWNAAKYNLPIPYDVKTGIASEKLEIKTKGVQRNTISNKLVQFEVGKDVFAKKSSFILNQR